MSSTSELLDSYLISEAKLKADERTPPDNNTFYPSSAGYCLRKQYMERKNPALFKPLLYKYFLIGNLLHEWIQKNLFKDAECEVPIQWTDKGLKFRGRIDTKLPDLLLEFKSIASLNYVMTKPKTEHLQQLNMYMHATGIHSGKIIYFTKNDVSIVEHDVTYDKTLYNKTVATFKRLKKYLDTDTVPPISSCNLPYFCDYCKEEYQKGRIIGKKKKDTIKKTSKM